MKNARTKPDGEFLESIAGLILPIVETAADLMGKPRKEGGYLCVARPDGLPLLLLSVGTMPEEKRLKYMHLCQEKAKRLSENPAHATSRQSRDESKEQFGGAVRIKHGKRGEFILSFSGLPEIWDEVCMLVLANYTHVKILGKSKDYEYVAEEWRQLKIKVPLLGW